MTEGLSFLYMCIKVKIVTIKLHVKERTVNKDIKAVKNGIDMFDSNNKKCCVNDVKCWTVENLMRKLKKCLSGYQEMFKSDYCEDCSCQG